MSKVIFIDLKGRAGFGAPPRLCVVRKRPESKGAVLWEQLR